MLLKQLSIQGVRNLAPAKLSFDSLNVFSGDNGSGKTSLLEAIHYLAMGRSFRTHLANRVINHDSQELVIWGQSDSHSIGLQRKRQGDITIKIDGEHVHRLSALVECLPLQVITPDSFSLLTSGPKIRRQFIDWGVFHLEPQFLQIWGKCKRLLRQRNSLLKRKASYREISFWDRELAQYSAELTALRKAYIDSFNPVLQGIIERFLPGVSVKSSYTPGWDQKFDLSELLEKNYPRELSLGYTLSGPHKSDLRLRCDNIPVHEVLSRGQLKLLTCALRIAQGMHLKQQGNKNTIYLVDDLASELDHQKRALLIEQLVATSAQLFISVIDPEQIAAQIEQYQATVFHVEHGAVTPLDH